MKDSRDEIHGRLLRQSAFATLFYANTNTQVRLFTPRYPKGRKLAIWGLNLTDFGIGQTKVLKHGCWQEQEALQGQEVGGHGSLEDNKGNFAEWGSNGWILGASRRRLRTPSPARTGTASRLRPPSATESECRPDLAHVWMDGM